MIRTSQKDTAPAADTPRSDLLTNHAPAQVALLVLVTCAIYLQVTTFGVMDTWDDYIFFLFRPELQDWWTASWYERLATPDIGYPIPIPTALHAWLRMLPGEWVVAASHGLNVVFHCINVALAYALLCRWLERRSHALAATLLWATHPLLAESVAWLTNLKTVSFAAFALAALLVWERQLRDSNWRWVAASLLLSILALGCRPEAVMLGPVMLLRALWTGGFEQTRQIRYWGLPALLGGLAAVYVPLAVGGHDRAVELANRASELEVGWVEHIQRIGAALFVQARHVVVPTRLHPSYYFDEYSGWATATAGFVIALVALVACALAWRRKSVAGWPLTFCVLVYLPASGVEFLPRFTADTYMYLPLIGFAAAIVAALASVSERWRPNMTAFFVAVFAILLAVGAYFQAQRWENTVTLWRPVMQDFPEYGQPYFMVGISLAKAGAYAEAVDVFDKGYEQILAWKPPPLEAAVAYAETGNAKRAYDVLVDILERKPNAENLRSDVFLVMLLIEHELPWPRAATERQLVRRAAMRAITEGDFPPSRLAEALRYFAALGEHELVAACRRQR